MERTQAYVNYMSEFWDEVTEERCIWKLKDVIINISLMKTKGLIWRK